MDLGDYIDFVNVYGRRFDACVALDVVGDNTRTMANLSAMTGRVGRGIRIMPVFHHGMALSYLTELGLRFDWVALASFRRYSRTPAELLDNLAAAVVAAGRGVRLHFLGATTSVLLGAFPFYSVDSSTWLSGGRYAQLARYDLVTGDRSVKPGGARTPTVAEAAAMACLGRKGETRYYQDMNIHNAHQTQKLADEMTALWTARGVTWTDPPALPGWGGAP